MKKECNIVRDILPLYVEKIVSDDTHEFVENHLASCEECRAEWQKSSEPAAFVADTDAAPLKAIQRKIRTNRLRTAALSLLLALAMMIAAYSALTAPRYLPYSPELIRVEKVNGVPMIAFSGKALSVVSAYEVSDAHVIRLSAWTTDWNRYFVRSEPSLPCLIPMEEDATVLYSPCDGSEDVLIYGDALPDTDGETDTGTILLPRLNLTYIFLLALAAAAALGVAWLTLRRHERLRLWAARLFFLPVSYVCAHLLVVGVVSVTYSAQRDLSLILLAVIPLYCAAMLGFQIYLSKKADKYGAAQ